MIKSAIFEANVLYMSPKSMLLLICLLLYGLIGSAQYTEKINTNRPGTSQGAFSVGNNVLQFEGGLGFGKQKHELLNTRTNTFTLDYSARYGLLFEQLEIRANGRYRNDGIRLTVGAEEQKIRQSNFELNTIGVKYLIFDPHKRRLKKELEEKEKRAKLFGGIPTEENNEVEVEEKEEDTILDEEGIDTKQGMEKEDDLPELEKDIVSQRIPDPTGRDSTGIEVVYDYKNRKVENDELKSWKKRHKFKWKSLIPALSAYVGANFVTEDNPFTAEGDEGFSPKIVIATQNNWYSRMSGDWVLVTNLIFDKITTDDLVIGWIITSTHTIKDKWAVFGEYQGQKSDFYSDNLLRLGGAYLLNNDLQIDANVAFNFKDTPSVFTCSVGASYRFDWHKKDEIIEQSGLKSGVQETEGEEEGEGIELDEFEEIENDSLKLEKTPFVNMFEEDDHREALEQDLDERRTAERLERERIAAEKIAQKEDKKFQKEERRRLKREEKEARKAEKAKLKEEQEKEKMLQEIDAELDKIEKDEGIDNELDSLDEELKKLEEEESKFNSEEEKLKQEERKQAEEERKQEQEDQQVDEDYDRLVKEQEKAKKEEEKRRKKEEKKRLKEEKKRKKEEEKRKKKENEGG